MHVDVSLSWRSLRVWRPLVSGKVNYAVWRVDLRLGDRFWLQMWTPIWHEGRGPYVSLGLGWLAIGRGY